MFRRNSPAGTESNGYAESIQSIGYSTMDDASSQVSNLSRPSAKSIYLQRREYADSINKMMDTFHYRVEHLFTCDLDGKELRNISDCVERLMLLDEMGRVWGQGMLLEVRGANLLLSDIETKEELESMALSDILELKAVLDSEGFKSLLTISVQARRKQTTTVFMFQCDDVRADFVQKSLSQAMSRRRQDPSISNAQQKGRNNIRNTPKPEPVPQWVAPDYEESVLESELDVPQEDEDEMPPLQRFPTQDNLWQASCPYTELDRNVDILNHILSDIEIIIGQVAAVEAKNAKKKKKKKKKKKGKDMDGMPSEDTFADCLHKIKCGFNILGEINGNIHNPSAPDFVHSLFSTLEFVVSHCSETLPPSIVAPLLTPQAIILMSEEASTEEDQLWQTLGDAWNIPSTKWPEDDEDIPTYTLEFFDGWQPPEVSDTPEPREQMRGPTPPVPRQSMRRLSTPEPREPVRRPSPPELREPVRRQSPPPQWPAQSKSPPKVASPRPKQKARQMKPRPMRVLYDFVARNGREITVRKGEMVELLDMSKQWWKVRNRDGDEGYVPNNVLGSADTQPIEETAGNPVLTRKSKPADVKAWLEDKEFSKITVRCLGGLSGAMLLGMPREELKTLCPEEGGRVFFQLQAVRSTLDAAI